MRENMAMFLEMNGSLSGGRVELAPLSLPRKMFAATAFRQGVRDLLQRDKERLPISAENSAKFRRWMS